MGPRMQSDFVFFEEGEMMTTLCVLEPEGHTDVPSELASFAPIDAGSVDLKSLDQADTDPTAPDPAQRIVDEVELRWRLSPYGGLATLHCVVQEQTIRIQGQVSCFYLKQMAQEALRDLVGTSHVENLAEVRPRGQG